MANAWILFHIWFIGALIYGAYLAFRSGKDLARSKIANPNMGVVISWSNIFWEMLLWFYFPITKFAVNSVVNEHNRSLKRADYKG
jgi:hypothetical protein